MIEGEITTEVTTQELNDNVVEQVAPIEAKYLLKLPLELRRPAFEAWKHVNSREVFNSNIDRAKARKTFFIGFYTAAMHIIREKK